MDERYNRLMQDLADEQAQKKPEDRNPVTARDIQLQEWFDRRRRGLPVQSHEEQGWRDNFSYPE